MCIAQTAIQPSHLSDNTKHTGAHAIVGSQSVKQVPQTLPTPYVRDTNPEPVNAVSAVSRFVFMFNTLAVHPSAKQAHQT
jgi:hypothetical protein